MSTITKERAQQIFLGNGPEPTASEERELARIALASLEAEAVHQVLTGDAWVDLSKGAMESQKRVGAIVRTVYTAPPAPVSVPDAMEMDDDFDSSFEHGKAVGWNACRAAILQGAEHVSNRDELTDGWVACSERMPDPESEYRICAYTPTPHEDVRFRFVPASLFKSVCRDATHWQYMLPPAAPQQEVK